MIIAVTASATIPNTHLSEDESANVAFAIQHGLKSELGAWDVRVEGFGTNLDVTFEFESTRHGAEGTLATFVASGDTDAGEFEIDFDNFSTDVDL